MSEVIDPDKVTISFIGDEIKKAIAGIRKEKERLPDYAQEKVEYAIKQLEDTSVQLEKHLCTRWFVPAR